MAITEFNLRWKQNRFRETQSGGIAWELNYQAISDSPGLDDETTVRNDPRCPRLGDAAPGLPGTLCTSIEVSPQESSRIEFVVRVEYTAPPGSSGGSEDSGGGEEQKPENPADDPATFEGDDNLVLKAYEYDLSGKLVANAAGDMFDPLPQRLEPNPVLVVSRFELNPPIEKQRLFSGKVNSATFFGEPPEKWLCRIKYRLRSIDREYTVEVGGRPTKRTRRWNGFDVTYRFEYKSEGWQDRLLNKGFNQIVRSTEGETIKQRIKINGEDAQNAQLLDADGGWIPVFDAISAVNSATYIDFRTYDTADFNQLGIFPPPPKEQG